MLRNRNIVPYIYIKLKYLLSKVAGGYKLPHVRHVSAPARAQGAAV